MFAIIGVPAAFVVILLLVRKKVPYGISILAGAAIIGIFCGFTGEDFLKSGIETVKDTDTINLTAIIILISIIGYSFKQTGQINITVEELRKIFGEKTVLAALPAVFGMLPIPGGALMSAPVIEPEANRLHLAPEHKTYLNIWFRHTLLMIFPLSAMIILSASLAKTSVYMVIAWLVPLFFLSVTVGYLIGLAPIKVEPRKKEPGSFLKAMYGISPIILVIVLNIVFNIGFAVGLVFGLLLLFVESKTPVREAARMVREGFSWEMAVAVGGIMFFRQIVNNSTVVTDIMALLEGSPVILLMVCLPMIISLFTGVAILSIGVSFPLLLPLSPFSPPLFAAVVYTSSFTGYLASPLHLCLIVTKEYFDCGLIGAYKRFLPSVAVLVCYNVLFALVFYHF
jgi:integral membrane protein (TIGR00529 family)